MKLYRLDASAAQLAGAFDADCGADPWQGGDVAPGHPAPVIISDGRQGSRRLLRPRLWGVAPPPRGADMVTNVRNLHSPFWIGTLRHTELRCLVPATSFALGSGAAGARRQRWFSLLDRPLFAFAGILRQNEDWPAYALLSTDANRMIARAHRGAMPLILRAEDHDRWLTCEWRDAATLVIPYPGQEMSASTVPQK